MKRILLSLIAATAIVAAVVIPLDIGRTNQNNVDHPAEESRFLEEIESSLPPESSEETSTSESSMEPSSTGQNDSESNGTASVPDTPDMPETKEYSRQKANEPVESALPAVPSSRSEESSQPASKPAPTPKPKPKPSQPASSAPAASSSAPAKPPASPESSRPSNPKPETPGASSSYAQQVVQLVNQERAKEGLQPLSISKPAESAALVRAKEIEHSFSHTRPNGKSFSSALTEQGVTYRSSGENIAWGQKTPEQVMQGWMNSPGHRANILNPKFTAIGVGYYQNGSGVNYWTQLFIG